VSPAPAATTLFTIDAAASKLATIGGVDGVPSPDAGATTDRGPLGVTVDSGKVGFDIAATATPLRRCASAACTASTASTSRPARQRRLPHR